MNSKEVPRIISMCVPPRSVKKAGFNIVRVIFDSMLSLLGKTNPRKQIRRTYARVERPPYLRAMRKRTPNSWPC